MSVYAKPMNKLQESVLVMSWFFHSSTMSMAAWALSTIVARGLSCLTALARRPFAWRRHLSWSLSRGRVSVIDRPAQAAQTSLPTPSIQLPNWLTLASHSFNRALMLSICFMSKTLGWTQLILAISAT